MNRRSFLESLAKVSGLLAATPLIPVALKKKPQIELGEALFFLPEDDESYSYRYVYRNLATGCCTDAYRMIPPRRTFAMPEQDVLDVYRMNDDGEFHYVATIPNKNQLTTRND